MIEQLIENMFKPLSRDELDARSAKFFVAVQEMEDELYPLLMNKDRYSLGASIHKLEDRFAEKYPKFGDWVDWDGVRCALHNLYVMNTSDDEQEIRVAKHHAYLNDWVTHYERWKAKQT